VAKGAPGAAGEAETAAMGGAATRVSLNVLAVDDDALVLTNTAAMLEDMGHRCIRSTSAMRALDLLRQGTQVDLVITDQVMPRMTGVQLAEAIATEWPDLPVIIATGYAELAPNAGANMPKLPKPFTQAELAAAVAGAQVNIRERGQVIHLRSAARD
jgi:CheY-like chemotaxis protein